MNLDALEVAKRGPFAYVHDGATHVAPDPAEMHFQEVLAVLYHGQVPSTPNMPFWKSEALFARWAAHFDLPSFQHAQRLCYLLDHYYDALEFDLRTRASVDARELWQSRDWRPLLNAIDHLPSDCWYSEAVANDPEHAQMVIEAMQQRESDDKDSGPARPALRNWNQQTAMLADLIDSVRNLMIATLAAGGQSNLPKFDPYTRPTSLLEQAQRTAEYRRRQSKHNALADRILMRRRAPEAEQQA